MSSATPIIDADSHVLEPPDLWHRYADPAYRDRVPFVGTGPDGSDTLRFSGATATGARGDTVFEQGVGHLGAFGAAWGHGSLDQPYLACRGGYDPGARLAHMDAEGITAAVLFPGIGLTLGGIEDPELAAACYRAYNRWLADFTSTAPDRLIGAAMVPLQSVDHAVDELRHARERLGMAVAFVRPNPYGGRMHHHADLTPFWQAAQELDVAVAIHSGSAADMATTGMEHFGDWFMTRHIVTHTLDTMQAMLSLVFCGVCDRFPALRVAFYEGGGGWVPGWLDRMDRHFEKVFYDGTLSERPSDIFRRQCWVSYDVAEGALPHVADYLDAGRILWASDYPHPDGLPGGTRYVTDNQHLSQAAKEAILGGSAATFLNLPWLASPGRPVGVAGSRA